MNNNIITSLNDVLVAVEVNKKPNTPGYATNAQLSELVGLGKKATRAELIKALTQKVTVARHVMDHEIDDPKTEITIGGKVMKVKDVVNEAGQLDVTNPVVANAVVAEVKADTPTEKMWTKELAVTLLHFSPAVTNPKTWDGNRDYKGNPQTVFYWGKYQNTGKCLAKAETLLSYAKHWLAQLCEQRGFDKSVWATESKAAYAIEELIKLGYLKVNGIQKMTKPEKNGHTSALESFLNWAVAAEIIADKSYRFTFELIIKPCADKIQEVGNYWKSLKKA